MSSLHVLIHSSGLAANTYEHLAPETTFLSTLPDDYKIGIVEKDGPTRRITLGDLRAILRARAAEAVTA